MVTVLWSAANFVNGGLLCLLARSGAFRRWPSLFALLWLVTAQTAFDCAVVLSGDYDRPYALYGHFAFALAMDAAEVWLITQMALALAGVTDFLREKIKRTVPALCAVMLCGSAAITFADPAPIHEHIQRFTATADMAISLAWAAAFLFLPLAARFFEVQWSGGVRPIALGFLVESFSTVVISFLAFGNVNRVQMTEFKSCTYLLTLALWSSSVIPYAQWASSVRRLLSHPYESLPSGRRIYE